MRVLGAVGVALLWYLVLSVIVRAKQRQQERTGR